MQCAIEQGCRVSDKCARICYKGRVDWSSMEHQGLRLKCLLGGGGALKQEVGQGYRGKVAGVDWGVEGVGRPGHPGWCLRCEGSWPGWASSSRGGPCSVAARPIHHHCTLHICTPTHE